MTIVKTMIQTGTFRFITRPLTQKLPKCRFIFRQIITVKHVFLGVTRHQALINVLFWLAEETFIYLKITQIFTWKCIEWYSN